MKRVMVFGTFDGIHDGHRHLFRQALDLGDEVIAVVARDEHVLELKGSHPYHRLNDRMEMVACESEVDLVIEGDNELGSYGVIVEHKPHLILLGYDQDDLNNDLEIWIEDQDVNVETMRASAYMPEVFKSSLLNTEAEVEML